MILVWLLIIPLAGGIAALAAGRFGLLWPRRISLAAMILELLASIPLLLSLKGPETGRGPWLIEVQADWIPQLGVTFHLGVDTLSLLLVLLTGVLGIVAILASWKEIRERAGFFYLNLLFTLAGVTGVFLALDLFLFYFFWELMLVPMFFIILLWGHERRTYGAVKFFIFTQAGGLLMLIAIVGLAFMGGFHTGEFSFDYADLMDVPMSGSTSLLLFSGFLAAFLVKLPAVPFHTWLADAHAEAPTAGSIILAGLLLKTGAYGLIRFAIPLFPDAAARSYPLIMVLAVAGILYGAVLACGQTDIKRLIAFTSISHMGFVLLGISAWNEIALQGAVMQMICHGVSTGALFMLAGALEQRTHTRDLSRMGGLWSQAPRMGGTVLFFCLASLGLPGLGNFMAEFLVLLGTFNMSVAAAAAASAGFVLATIYALRLVGRIFFGEPGEIRSISDLSLREAAPFAILMAFILWIGLFPQAVINTVGPAIRGLIETTGGGPSEANEMDTVSAGEEKAVADAPGLKGTGS